MTDDGGASRTIPSDSALAALETADAQSPDFSISDLAYYADFGSFYVKCLDIAATTNHACDNWQYVVNSAYPPVGANAYTVSNGDTLYFYFGSPRKVSLSASSVQASTSFDVLAQTYDYTNNTWQSLAGALIGATQPNPNDAYSPLVIVSATSDASGIAHIAIPTPGTYSIGLASDYYYPSELLTVTAVASPVAPTIVPPAPMIEETTITLNMPISTFIKNYKEITATAHVQAIAIKPIVAPISQTASVVNSRPTGWFSGLLKLFGF